MLSPFGIAGKTKSYDDLTAYKKECDYLHNKIYPAKVFQQASN